MLEKNIFFFLPVRNKLSIIKFLKSKDMTKYISYGINTEFFIFYFYIKDKVTKEIMKDNRRKGKGISAFKIEKK